MTQTYEAWRITYQSSEQAARAAFERMMELEQGKCLHQIAEPAQTARPAFEAISQFMKCEWSLDWDKAGFYDDAKVDAAFTWFEKGYMHAQHAAAPQAVQAAVPATNHSETPNSSTIIVPYGWKLVPDDATPEWVTNLEALPDWREAVGECIKRFLAAAPAHPAEGVPAQDAEAKIEELLALARIMVRAALDADNKTQVQEIKAAIESEVAFERAVRAALASTQPAAQGLDADSAIRHLAIGRAIERVCVELPDGAEISISLEKGAGTVTLIDGNGDEQENFPTDDGFAGTLNAAVDTAIADEAAIAAQAKQGGA